MSLSKETLQFTKLWLVEWIMYWYSELRNVRVQKPPYSVKERPNRFFLCRRDGYSYKKPNFFHYNDDCSLQPAHINWWRIVDIMVQNGVEYYMRISNDKTKIRIYRSTDWCNLYKIIEDCFCNWWFEYFQPIHFVTGKPKELYTDWTTPYWIQWTWTQVNNLITQSPFVAHLTNETTDEYNFNNWPTSIEPLDYVYVYSEDWTAQCWQYNQVTNIDSDWNLTFDAWWTWFDPWQYNPEYVNEIEAYIRLNWSTKWLPQNYFLVEPQEEWTNANFMVFWEFWETFAFQTCSWTKIFHYFEEWYNDCKWITTSLCQFGWCYSQMNVYSWQNGISQSVFLDNANNVFLYSNPWQLWILSAGNTIPVKSGIQYSTTFQSFITYFGSDFIWAFYINPVASKVLWTTTYQWVGNIIRNNLGIWTNPKISDCTPYDEYQNSLYFIASNKRLYALNIVASQNGLLQSKLTDMTEDDRWRRIVWDLQNIQKWDHVSIDANDDYFQIFINSSRNGNGSNSNTKILTWNRRYKIRTTDTSCCAVICKKETTLNWEVFLWDHMYHECWDYDCDDTPVEWLIKSYLFEDEVALSDIGTFPEKTLWGIWTQVWHDFKDIWETQLSITWFHKWIKIKMTVDDIDNTPYLDVIKDIWLGKEPKPSQCLLNTLKWCQHIVKSKCPWSQPLDYNTDLQWACTDCEWQDDSCHCPPKKIIKDYCFCYDDWMYHMSPFSNLYTDLKKMKWDMFVAELRFKQRLCFWWWLVSYRVSNPQDTISNCQKWECTDCGRDVETSQDFYWECF